MGIYSVLAITTAWKASVVSQYQDETFRTAAKPASAWDSPTFLRSNMVLVESEESRSYRGGKIRLSSSSAG